jgi:hypothetical protein
MQKGRETLAKKRQSSIDGSFPLPLLLIPRSLFLVEQKEGPGVGVAEVGLAIAHRQHLEILWLLAFGPQKGTLSSFDYCFSLIFGCENLPVRSGERIEGYDII